MSLPTYTAVRAEARVIAVVRRNAVDDREPQVGQCVCVRSNKQAEALRLCRVTRARREAAPL